MLYVSPMCARSRPVLMCVLPTISNSQQLYPPPSPTVGSTNVDASVLTTVPCRLALARIAPAEAFPPATSVRFAEVSGCPAPERSDPQLSEGGGRRLPQGGRRSPHCAEIPKVVTEGCRDPHIVKYRCSLVPAPQRPACLQEVGLKPC